VSNVKTTRTRGLLLDALAVLVLLAVCVSLLHPVLLGGNVLSASHWWARHGPSGTRAARSPGMWRRRAWGIISAGPFVMAATLSSPSLAIITT
jgi:hypothetical protein